MRKLVGLFIVVLSAVAAGAVDFNVYSPEWRGEAWQGTSVDPPWNATAIRLRVRFRFADIDGNPGGWYECELQKYNGGWADVYGGQWNVAGMPDSEYFYKCIMDAWCSYADNSSERYVLQTGANGTRSIHCYNKNVFTIDLSPLAAVNGSGCPYISLGCSSYTCAAYPNAGFNYAAYLPANLAGNAQNYFADGTTMSWPSYTSSPISTGSPAWAAASGSNPQPVSYGVDNYPGAAGFPVLITRAVGARVQVVDPYGGTSGLTLGYTTAGVWIRYVAVGWGNGSFNGVDGAMAQVWNGSQWVNSYQFVSVDGVSVYRPVFYVGGGSSVQASLGVNMLLGAADEVCGRENGGNGSGKDPSYFPGGRNWQRIRDETFGEPTPATATNALLNGGGGGGASPAEVQTAVAAGLRAAKTDLGDAVGGSVGTQLNTRVDNVKSAVDAAKTQGTTDAGNITSAVNSNGSAIGTAIGGTTAATNAVKNSVDAAKSSTDAVKSSVDATKSSVDAAKSSTDAVKTSVDATKSATDLVKTAVDSAKSSTDLVRSSVDSAKSSAESKADHIRDAIQDLEDQMVNLEGQRQWFFDGQTDAAIAMGENMQAGLERQLEQLEAEIATMEAVENSDTAAQSAASDAADGVAGVRSDLSDLEAAVVGQGNNASAAGIGAAVGSALADDTGQIVGAINGAADEADADMESLEAAVEGADTSAQGAAADAADAAAGLQSAVNAAKAQGTTDASNVASSINGHVDAVTGAVNSSKAQGQTNTAAIVSAVNAGASAGVDASGWVLDALEAQGENATATSIGEAVQVAMADDVGSLDDKLQGWLTQSSAETSDIVGAIEDIEAPPEASDIGEAVGDELLPALEDLKDAIEAQGENAQASDIGQAVGDEVNPHVDAVKDAIEAQGENAQASDIGAAVAGALEGADIGNVEVNVSTPSASEIASAIDSKFAEGAGEAGEIDLSGTDGFTSGGGVLADRLVAAAGLGWLPESDSFENKSFELVIPSPVGPDFEVDFHLVPTEGDLYFGTLNGFRLLFRALLMIAVSARFLLAIVRLYGDLT